ncbi:MAG: glycosyltransferase N-terminal domain-containing protein, partial [Pseudomonadota bacterium]|nr:glycosyltransferase N-terminal domain-containing protein [Pseudomonadota bacterium]
MLAVRAYQLGVMLGGGLLPLLLERRAKAGREDPARLEERKARDMAPRPAGNLVWLHAASVGETRSALPLLADFLAARPDTHILITTGTRTSATLVGQLKHASFPDIDRLTHQYLPLDRPLWVKRFLDHWSPQLSIFVESELWPNLLLEMRRRNIPATLINGRLSEKSFKFWRRAKNSARALFGCFDRL